ncbi:MAG TPA: SAM-dependent methyltransferase [Thermoanaerobaculia bacterium]|nr:SAM-dependent methyltransferase [Thermoanaerobaculia bacterium]
MPRDRHVPSLRHPRESGEPVSPSSSPGSLTLVGVGYGIAAQVTAEAHAALVDAERLFYLVTDPATAAYLQRLNSTAETLAGEYGEGVDGLSASAAMVERILGTVRGGARTCAAFSGHPSLFCGPTLPALRAAQAEGYPARILAGVSCEDVLWAELGGEALAERGRLLYEATDFLVRPRIFDPALPLVLLQVGVIGLRGYRAGAAGHREGVVILTEVLLATYPPAHPVILFEASPWPLLPSRLERLELAHLPEAAISVQSTLLVLPYRG